MTQNGLKLDINIKTYEGQDTRPIFLTSYKDKKGLLSDVYASFFVECHILYNMHVSDIYIYIYIIDICYI